MSTAQQPVGSMLRQWRERRRRTQMDLALDAGISARHLSFVETGRSRPGADVILKLAEQLEVPFRERNALLLAAGHAPALPEPALDDPRMAATRAALEQVLTNHEPFPAMVVDRHWNLVAANSAMEIVRALIDPSLIVPPFNVMRAALHPDGLGRWLVDYPRVHAHWLARLRHQATATADPVLAELLDEISGYANGIATPEPSDVERATMAIRLPDGTELTFFALFATFDAPFDVTTAELALELAYPADPLTAELMRTGAALSSLAAQ